MAQSNASWFCLRASSCTSPSSHIFGCATRHTRAPPCQAESVAMSILNMINLPQERHYFGILDYGLWSTFVATKTPLRLLLMTKPSFFMVSPNDRANERGPEDAGIPLLFHAKRQWPGTSD